MAEEEKLLHSASVYILKRNRTCRNTTNTGLKHEIPNQKMGALLRVEDDDGAAVAFRAALDEANVQVAVDRVVDGQQALEYLRGGRNVCGRRAPKAVFLDLNLPRVDSWQVLVAISQNEHFDHTRGRSEHLFSGFRQTTCICPRSQAITFANPVALSN